MNNYFLDAVQAWKASKHKLRPEWRLAALKEEQLAEVLRLLATGIRYKELREIIAKDFGVTLASDRTLSEFWSSARLFILPARLKSAALGADSIGKNLPQLDEKNFYLIKQAAFELLSSPQPDPAALARMINAVIRIHEGSLKEQDIAIKLRRLELLERQAKETMSTLKDSRLSDSEKAERIRKIFKK